ncbi:MAG TPA: frataxin domain-containing protein [Bryobacteraceae bacterium]|nr:frataxin domain-containing protein [Bryobacteraceae bacterium]
MSGEHDFRKHAQDALTALQSDLVLAGDDYGFESSLHGGAITISFDRPPGKFTIVPEASGGQIKATLGTRVHKLDWDIVENTFVHTESGQTLKEMVEQAISKYLKRDVEL